MGKQTGANGKIGQSGCVRRGFACNNAFFVFTFRFESDLDLSATQVLYLVVVLLGLIVEYDVVRINKSPQLYGNLLHFSPSIKKN